MSPSGLIILDKDPGVSSARAVGAVKRLLPKGTKIGHAGTLDPFATGVLLLLVGKATKQCERLMDQPKEYLATVRLGATSATDDTESPPEPVIGATPVARERLELALTQFSGSIRQRPPAFSALKLQGRPAYELARRGEAVHLEERTVQVYRVELLEYQWPDARIRVECGRGTYIRAIARDLGQSLGVGGYLVELSRTRIGPFALADAVTLPRLRDEGVAAHLKPAAI